MWSYFAAMGDPKDQVRFLIQDTVTLPNTSPPSGILQDEEINFILGQEANVYMAAARALEIAATNVLSMQSRSTSSVSVSYFQPSQVKVRADDLRKRGLTYQRPTIGGISQADKQVLTADPDWPAPPFTVGMTDNRFAAGPQLSDPAVVATGT